MYVRGHVALAQSTGRQSRGVHNRRATLTTFLRYTGAIGDLLTPCWECRRFALSKRDRLVVRGREIRYALFRASRRSDTRRDGDSVDCIAVMNSVISCCLSQSMVQ